MASGNGWRDDAPPSLGIGYSAVVDAYPSGQLTLNGPWPAARMVPTKQVNAPEVGQPVCVPGR